MNRSTEINCELFCPNFGLCGGCLFLATPYPNQLRQKENIIVSLLGHLTDEILPIIPSPQIYFYRNKMEFAFGKMESNPSEIPPLEKGGRGDLILGLRVRNKFNKIVNVEHCLLQSPESNDYLSRIRNFFNCKDKAGLVPTLQPYNLLNHTGHLRYFVIREGKNTDEKMVILVTAGLTDCQETEIKKLFNIFPELTTFIWSVNNRKGDSACGEKISMLSGPGYISEKLNRLLFKISPYSFFQTNSLGAEKLYQIVGQQAGTGKLVFDVYCGGGGIAISLSSQFGKIIGIENSLASVSDARTNAQLNNISNCEFICGDAGQILGDLSSKDCPDAVVVDPPRAGLTNKVIKSLLLLEPLKIIYVSCNPQSLFSDLAKLKEKYAVKFVQPIDLFPHTPHLETVVTLEKS